EQVLERAAQDIDADERPEVADVAAGIDGQAAGVHADGVVGTRREVLLTACQRVVEAHGDSGARDGACGPPLGGSRARDDDLQLAGLPRAGGPRLESEVAAAPARRAV